MNEHILDSWKYTSHLSKLTLPISVSILLTSLLSILMLFMYYVSFYRPLLNQNPDAKDIKEDAVFIKHTGFRVTLSKLQRIFIGLQLVTIFTWSIWHLYSIGPKAIDNLPVGLCFAGIFAINLPYYIANCIYDAKHHYSKSDLIFDHKNDIKLISFKNIQESQIVSITIMALVVTSLAVTVILTPFSQKIYTYDDGHMVVDMFKNHNVQPKYRFTADIQTEHKHGVWKESLKHSKHPLYIQDHFTIKDLHKGSRLYE